MHGGSDGCRALQDARFPATRLSELRKESGIGAMARFSCPLNLLQLLSEPHSAANMPFNVWSKGSKLNRIENCVTGVQNIGPIALILVSVLVLALVLVMTCTGTGTSSGTGTVLL